MEEEIIQNNYNSDVELENFRTKYNLEMEQGIFQNNDNFYLGTRNFINEL